MKIVTHSEDETVSAGKEFAGRLQRGDVVALFGDLGTGKTRFIKGMCLGLGVHEHVASPTFTILREYTAGKLKVHHFDFYRIASEREISEIGFEEFVNNDGICFIEWADRVQKFLPPNRYDVHLKLGENSDTREMMIVEIVGAEA